MDPLPVVSISSQQTPATVVRFGPTCAYCGTPLDSQLYFCSGCATPYRSIEQVIPAGLPVPLTEAKLITKKAPHVMTVFWSYFGLVLLSGIVPLLIFQLDESKQLLQDIVGTAIFAAGTCVIGAIFWRTLLAQFKQIGFFNLYAYAGILGLIPLLAINFGMAEWLYHAFHHFSRESAKDPLSLNSTALVFLVCVFPAITEEIAFRGLIQQWLMVAVRPGRAIVLASALFGLMHFAAYGLWGLALFLPYLFGVGCLLGWTRWKTGSLYPSMLIHFLHNFVVLIYFSQWIK